MRVVYLNHVGATLGGAERTLATTIEHMPSDFEQFAILFEDGKFGSVLRADGVKVEIISASTTMNGMTRETFNIVGILEMLPFTVKVAQKIKSLKVDVVYTNSMKAHIVGALAAKLANVPCIMHFHDHVSGYGLETLRVFSRLGSRHRIACSQNVRKHIGLLKTSVIYSPIDVEFFSILPSKEEAIQRLGLRQDLPIVSLIGRINRWKGHDRFVRIAEAVNSRRRVQFVIAGSPMFRDDDFLPELEKTVSARSLQEVVTFIPWVDDVRTLFAASDVVANCSTREPLGRTPGEATAAGIPSIVFSDSGAAEWMTDIAGLCRIVPAGDETAFAQAILDILSGRDHIEPNPALKAVAMRFEPRAVAADVANVIRNAVRPNAPEAL